MVSNLTVKVGADIAGLQKELQKATGKLQGFGSSLKGIAGSLGIAFGIQQIASFTVEVSKLAGQAEAVQSAFDRLPKSIQLMQDLKRATGGTVSELGLMKRAVQASNFDISLNALPRLLEFATLRAQQTGQSVDYLVDSIVTGIGRKSKLILDNLGISAVQLNEALGGASTAASTIGEVADAVGRIAEENLKGMAGFSENAATKMERLAASWENVKVAIGNAANGTGVLGGFINATTGYFEVFASKNLTFFEKLQGLLGGVGGFTDALTESIIRNQEAINKQAGNTEKVIPPIVKEITTLNSLKEKLTELNEIYTQVDIHDRNRLINIGNQITATKDLIDKIEDLKNATLEKDLAAWKAKASAPMKEGVTDKKDPSGEFMFNSGAASNMVNVGMAALAQLSKGFEMNKQSVEDWASTMKIMGEQVSGTWVDLSGNISSAISSIAEGFGDAISGVGSFGDAIIKTVIGFAKQLGEILIAAGVAMLAAKLLITNPFTAIAGGVALLAVAGAASAAFSKSQGSFNSGSGNGGGGGRYGANGKLPSEMQAVRVNGEISGYTIRLNQDKESYRRGIVG